MKARSVTLALLCFGLLAAGPAPAAQAAEAGSHGFLYEIHGFKGPSGNEAFEGPCGVVVDSSANIYVSDYYRDRILIFPTSGGVPSGNPPAPTVLGGEDPGDGPCGLAMSSSALYVNNYHQDVVRYPLVNGTPDLAGGTVIDSAHSTGVAFDNGTGQVFVDDGTFVAVYEESGAPVEVGGEPLRIGVGTLGEGYGVAVSEYAATEGLVYVADASTGTLKVYDSTTGSKVGEIDGEATAEGGFWDLTDAALAVSGNDGHVYVTHKPNAFYEHAEDLVDEFNLAGHYRGRVLPGSLIDGEPTGIAIVPAGFTGAGNLLLTSGNGDAGKMLGLAPTGPAHVLTVSKKGTGSGEVMSEPAGIRCGGACTAEFNSGASVTLTATPAAGSVFAGWTAMGGGASCSGTGSCQITLSADVEVAANFEPAPAGAAAARTAASGSAPALAAPTVGASSGPSGPMAERHSRQTSVDGRGLQARRRHRIRHHRQRGGHGRHRHGRRRLK